MGSSIEPDDLDEPKRARFDEFEFEIEQMSLPEGLDRTRRFEFASNCLENMFKKNIKVLRLFEGRIVKTEMPSRFETATELAKLQIHFHSKFRSVFPEYTSVLRRISRGPVRLFRAAFPTAHEAALSFGRDLEVAIYLGILRHNYPNGGEQEDMENWAYECQEMETLSNLSCWRKVRQSISENVREDKGILDSSVLESLLALERASAIEVLVTGPRNQESSPEWPPDSGWHFQLGRFAFKNRVGQLKGNPWEVLKVLAARKNAVSCEELMLAVWRETDPNVVTRDTVRQTIYAARRALRMTFQLSDKEEPIPSQDSGPRLGWRIDENILR